MKEHVIITIHTSTGEPEENFTTKHFGSYQCVDGAHLISYEEYLEEDVPGDGSGALQSSLHIDPAISKVILNRRGSSATKMVFQKDAPYSGMYHTPYGSMPMDLSTEHLSITETDQSLEIHIRYRFMLGGVHVADNQLHIKIYSSDL